MVIIPRSYQSEAVECLYEYFKTHETGNPVIAMPTGTGKSVVIAMFLESIFKQWMNQRVLVVTHVKELIEQNYMKLIQFWPTAPAGIYSAGLNRRDTLQKILFCGIASIAKKAQTFGHVDLVIIDEAHLVSPSDETMYRLLLKDLTAINPHLRVIGLTATPWRLGHGAITEGEDSLFTDTAFDITHLAAFNRLIAEGYIAPLIPKKTQMRLSVDGLHMRGGEFIPGELQVAVNKEEITECALRELLETCDDRKHWLVFSAGVDHAESICDRLNDLGIPAGVVHSKMPSKQRDQNIRDFKSGKLRAVVNNNVLTTGFDYPEIDLIACLRPTASSVLWVQMLGRGTRPAPGKENCLVMDFAGNTRRLGPINDPLIPPKKGKSSGEAPVKECPICECYVHASLRFCNGIKKDGTKCDHEFTFETKLKQEASTEQIIKGDLPIVERFQIDRITFDLHRKEGRPDAMRVSYYVNHCLQKFPEYICVEHPGYAGKKARDWMRARMPAKELPIPETTQRALEYAHNFKVPSAVKIWINKKYPEILGFEWEEKEVPVDVSASGYQVHAAEATSSVAWEDEDIPF